MRLTFRQIYVDVIIDNSIPDDDIAYVYYDRILRKSYARPGYKYKDFIDTFKIIPVFVGYSGSANLGTTTFPCSIVSCNMDTYAKTQELLNDIGP